MKNELIAKRMQFALSNANMKPQESADKPGIGKASVSQYALAEESGHYHATAGNIICQSTVSGHKQELRARPGRIINSLGVLELV